MGEFTEGKWKVSEDRDGGFTVEADDTLLQLYYMREDNHDYIEYENAEANAHLISAAPDMYEALKALIDHEASPDFTKWARIVENAEAAISKANPNNTNGEKNA